MTEACENCRFYLLQGSRCRRYPPRDTGGGVYAQSPTVAEGWWCGEWEAARVGKKEESESFGALPGCKCIICKNARAVRTRELQEIEQARRVSDKQ